MKQTNSKNRSGLVRVILSVLVAASFTWSCRPDFDLDKRFPEWLGTSIYETLDKGFDGHTFKYYVRLIDSLGQKSILAKTGSRTLFVADDEAFEKFLAKCPIAGYKSIKFEDLTQAQMKMILKGSMLNNVYQVAALSSTSTESNGVRLGDCMRKVSTMSEYDSVRVMQQSEMPDSKYWAYVKNNSNRAATGIVILEDGTKKPLVMFAPKFLEKNGITADDYNFLFNLSDKYGAKNKPGREPDDASVNGVRILIHNKKCYNGFIHVMEDVVYLLPSIAEYLAQSDLSLPADSTTVIWSSIIERFSVPYALTRNEAADVDHTYSNSAYDILQLANDNYYGKQSQAIIDAIEASTYDTVFTKLYFAGRYQGGDTLKFDGKGKKYEKSAVLKFDPGWNSFTSPSNETENALQRNMAAMFVPSDKAVMEWWLTSALGQEMRGKYGLQKYKGRFNLTREEVAEDMDSIDLNVIVKLINNSMFLSLVNTVPSKFADVLNDAQDPMFKNPSTATDFFDKVVMCCNGAIFYSNQVFVPTAYKAVSYPALVNNKLKVMDWAIEDDDMSFSYYLNSMVSKYALFLPEVTYSDTLDADLHGKLIWVDPASFAINNIGSGSTDGLKALAFFFEDNKIKADIYDYDDATNTIGIKRTSKPIGEKDAELTFLRNRLEDIMDYHIILLNNDYYALEGGINPDPQGYAYFRTKGGGTIRFKSNGAKPYTIDQTDEAAYQAELKKMSVEGGWQVEIGKPINIINRFDMTKNDGNGVTYITDRPMQTSRRSVYDVISDVATYPEFAKFSELIQKAVDSEGKQIIFSDYDGLDIGSSQCVSSFNTFNYTVYVPKSATIQKLLDDTVIYHPVDIDAIETRYKKIWNNLVASFSKQYDLIDAAWSDSMALFASTLSAKDKAARMDTVLVNYNHLFYNDKDESGEIKDDEVPLEHFISVFTDAKRDELVNFLKYHIQDNSVYTNAEFNNSSDEVDYETSFLNKADRQFAKVHVKSGDNIVIRDENNNTRNVIKENVAGTKTPYYNIMCREYVFKVYNDDYAVKDGNNDVTDVSKAKLETSSFAVVHLIDGPLCNGEVKF